MDASRTLMTRLEEIQARGRTLPPIIHNVSHAPGNVPANRQKIVTQSTFYDGQSGRLMRMADLTTLELPNPMDLKGYLVQNGQPEKLKLVKKEDESF